MNRGDPNPFVFFKKERCGQPLQLSSGRREVATPCWGSNPLDLASRKKDVANRFNSLQGGGRWPSHVFTLGEKKERCGQPLQVS